MKVLLSLIAVLAISLGFVSSQVTTAEFETQIHDLRARFNEIHKVMDFYLRDSRWNVSDLLHDWNRDLLTHHAHLTTDIQNRRYEVYYEILDRVGELGNQNECLISLDNRLTAASVAATEDAKQCAQSAYDFVSDAIRDNYFDVVNAIQRESSSGQHVQFYGMGRYNVITNQQGVLNFLEGVWDEVEHGWPNIWSVSVDEQESILNVYRNGGIEYSNACIALVYGNYEAAVNVIRGDIAGCT